MLRALICGLLSVCLVLGPSLGAKAADPGDDPVAGALGDGAEGAGILESYYGARKDLDLFDFAKAWTYSDANMDDIKDALRAAKNSAELESVSGKVGQGLTGGQVAWHLANGEWKAAAEVALAGAIDLASKGMTGPLAWLAGSLCAEIAMPAVCYTAVMVAGTWLKSKGAEALAHQIVNLDWSRLYCRFRPRSNSCDLVPATRPLVAGQGPPPPDIVSPAPPAQPVLADMGRPAEPKIGAAGQVFAQGGSARGGGGSTQIDVSTGDVATHALGGGTATTDIAVSEKGGGKQSVRTGDVTTLGAGQDASTTIGGGSGVVVTGDVLNYGGDLEIGASGASRDGKKCVEIYRDTCIIHFYFRRKKDPCLPGYWIDGRKCRLPADTRHKIK